MPKKVFAPGNRWLVAYLAFLSAFAPLSTDMYLPALPHMTQALQTTDALSSLSISCFLLLFGASMLFWGPLSDKYGRKPVLYTGALLYVVSSLFLALAQSIWPLLFWRAVQAIGSGGISAMALAIVKDVLRGRAMEKVITWIQTITILAPMLAPVIGGALLAVTDWRGIFACLLLCGLLAGAGTLLLRETMTHPVQGNASARWAVCWWCCATGDSAACCCFFPPPACPSWPIWPFPPISSRACSGSRPRPTACSSPSMRA